MGLRAIDHHTYYLKEREGPIFKLQLLSSFKRLFSRAVEAAPLFSQDLIGFDPN